MALAKVAVGKATARQLIRRLRPSIILDDRLDIEGVGDVGRLSNSSHKQR